jgi:hypothetical protein
MEGQSAHRLSRKLSWIAIWIFLAALTAGLLSSWMQQAHSGEEQVAAAHTGLVVTGCILLIGLPFAVGAFLKGGSRVGILNVISSLLYGVALVAAAIFFVVRFGSAH